jgi:cephalosporin hydroxylase
MSEFDEEVENRIGANAHNESLQASARSMMKATIAAQYSYNFSWLGRPIIQYPQDIVAMQELIWSLKPDLIIETGIAHGGSLIFYASMLELNAACGGPQGATIVGVDIDIRAHNRVAIERHPMIKRIEMIEGSSISSHVIQKIQAIAVTKERVLVSLDSNHTHSHVLAELEAYASLATVGSYCVVFDTIIEDLPEETYLNRSWGPRNNPKTAVAEFLKTHPEFQVDRRVDNKLLVSAAPGGFLKRISK